MPFGGADLHFHSTVSDGLEPPSALAARAAAAGLSVAALTDHDAVHGIAAFEAAAGGTGLVATGGVELSVYEDGEDVHLLGLFVDPEEPTLVRRLEEIRGVRDRRGEAMAVKLAALGIELDLSAIRAGVGEGALGRPHVARALVATGVVASTEEAFARFLGEGRPAFVPKARWGLAEAIAAVRRAGGLAVLAHPVWCSDPAAVLRRARGLGLDGVEVYHPDNEGREEELLGEAGALGLLVTGGSDFHAASEGGRTLGDRRLGEADWMRLSEAATLRRREAGRVPPAFRPR
jgi:hypothetical protein